MSRHSNGQLTQAARISYGIMIALLALIGFLHLATLVLTSLFGYFILRRLTFRRRKWMAALLYLLLVVGVFFGFGYFSKQAVVGLPSIVEKTIPAVVEYAEKRGLDLPFTDLASLKTLALDATKEKLTNVGSYARGAAFEIASLVAGLVVAVSLFLDSKFGDEPLAAGGKDNLYAAVSRELAIRFKAFYKSFSTVIGAQIIISGINTALTTVFLLWNHYPHITIIIPLTFGLGLLPILGNLLSNALIIGVGFTISPGMALAALVFLVVIHKLEYFLNSKIIGDRIKNPMWLTLIGLVVGERLMGIPGMIFAPVVLHYLKVEASRSPVEGGGKVEELEG
jgi:predicted PurR-regulated permease PerM